ncbi:hypothetical protein E2C01_088558 [Portunus trituberculatus]|uniref:Uncharacterized protein n=1 Tax=Portunus trituberculatus TaxID=210409 RepID=A0A5B7JB34_PORTR|nr:hypothetical protein [Portunus trituberculatus]
MMTGASITVSAWKLGLLAGVTKRDSLYLHCPYAMETPLKPTAKSSEGYLSDRERCPTASTSTSTTKRVRQC